MDVREHNRDAWDRRVTTGNAWTIPVTSEQVAEARAGRWSIILTPTKPVPTDWYPPLEGADVLCLASGGGQQGPILAAAGGRVTVLDNSPKQLERDRAVAERDGLELRTVEGDMRDLSAFEDASFDLIVHPVSNCFIPDVRPVWQEAFRVLRPGGRLLSGFCNPLVYMFDPILEQEGALLVRYSIPYSDLEALTPEERKELYGDDDAIEFGHSLTDQIGGQIDAGFSIQGFYEDRTPDDTLSPYADGFVATLAVKAGV